MATVPREGLHSGNVWRGSIVPTRDRQQPDILKGGQRKAESLYCTGNGRENRFEVLTLPPGQGESADWTDL